MTEVEVTLLNVGGINNTPLEYYAGMTDPQSNTMNSLLANAIKNVLPENEAAKQLSKSATPDFYTGEGKGIMEAYQKAVYELFKAFIQPILDTQRIPDSSIPPNMPAIESRFRASISSEGIFDKSNFKRIVDKLIKLKDSSSFKDLDKKPEIFNEFLTEILENIIEVKVNQRHWTAETEYLKEAFNEESDVSSKRTHYFKIGYLFDQFAHLITLYEGMRNLLGTETEPLTQLANSYDELSEKIMTAKKNALEKFLSPGGDINKVVLLNECHTSAESVNVVLFSGADEVDKHEEGKKYSAICDVNKTNGLEFDDTCKKILEILFGTTFTEGKDTSKTIAAEVAVGVVTINENKIYFVCIHCNSWLNDEKDDVKLQRAQGIEKVLNELNSSPEIQGKKIIIGIDTNTAHIRNRGVLKGQRGGLANEIPKDTWRILAPETVNENETVENGVSSEDYYTVNQTRSFFQSQIGKAGVTDKKTKDLIIGMNIEEFKEMEILEFNGEEWTKRGHDSHAPNEQNPFDHYAVRVKIRVGEAQTVAVESQP